MGVGVIARRVRRSAKTNRPGAQHPRPILRRRRRADRHFSLLPFHAPVPDDIYEMPPTEAAARLRGDDPPVLIDVREPWEHGVARIEEIKLDDGQWKVEGRDSLGSEIEIKLRASDGTIIKLERERPASAKAGN